MADIAMRGRKHVNISARKPPARAWLLCVGWYWRCRCWISQRAPWGVISWFEFIVFRRGIVVGSLFSGKAAPKITLRCFHQPDHQIFAHSVDRSILIDFGFD